MLISGIVDLILWGGDKVNKDAIRKGATGLRPSKTFNVICIFPNVPEYLA